MDFLLELLFRVGPLIVFGVVFLGFVYWVTQVQPRR